LRKATDLPRKGSYWLGKENEMSKVTLFALFGAAIILVVAVSTATFFRPSAPEMPPSLAPANAIVESVDFAPVAVQPMAVQPVAARSLYLSEPLLRSRLDEAYERGPKSQVQALLQILNGRYEHRCCGLPR
jgi:hypothetical protein